MKNFWTTFRYTYKNLRSHVLGWGLGLALYGLMVVPIYDTMAAQMDQFQQMLASYPEEFLAFFGANAASSITPAGYLQMYAFSMLPVIVGIFAVLAGSGLIVSDEEHGRLDLIIAHPVGRSAFFFGRFMAFLAAAVSIMILGWLGFSVLLSGSSLDFTWGQMAVAFIPLLVQTLVIAMLALLLSMLLPSRNLASMVTGIVLVASYFISSMASLDTRLATAAKFMPYHYFQVTFSLSEINLIWLLALIGISLLMLLAAWLRFIRRDLRLSGEGSWRFLFFTRRRNTA
jgi:ABC-2 type transport system permease protein